VPNADVDHVHFERVAFGGKNFDMVIIFKAGSRDKGEEEWLRVSSIPMASLDTIKSWLDEIADITFSESTTTYAWKSVLEDVVRKEDFYLSEGAFCARGWRGWQGLRACCLASRALAGRPELREGRGCSGRCG
jgi:hypothetical protein